MVHAPGLARDCVEPALGTTVLTCPLADGSCRLPIRCPACLGLTRWAPSCHECELIDRTGLTGMETRTSRDRCGVLRVCRHAEQVCLTTTHPGSLSFLLDLREPTVRRGTRSILDVSLGFSRTAAVPQRAPAGSRPIRGMNRDPQRCSSAGSSEVLLRDYQANAFINDDATVGTTPSSRNAGMKHSISGSTLRTPTRRAAASTWP